jgi:hypothetical protein
MKFHRVLFTSTVVIALLSNVSCDQVKTAFLYSQANTTENRQVLAASFVASTFFLNEGRPPSIDDVEKLSNKLHASFDRQVFTRLEFHQISDDELVMIYQFKNDDLPVPCSYVMNTKRTEAIKSLEKDGR